MDFLSSVVSQTTSFFSGEAPELSFEQFYLTDQISEYLDSEFQDSDENCLNAEERMAFLEMKTKYYNALQGIQFQNQVIYTLVSDLLELRMNAFFDDEDSGELSKKVASLKMDISDRKTKRYFYRKKRQDLSPELSKLIGAIKLHKFRSRGKQESEDNDHGPKIVESKSRPKRSTMRRRKGFKLYSDAELKEILR